MTAETFGERIRRKRGEKRVGLRQAAGKVDISPTFLSRVETGAEKAIPSEKVIRKLADILDDDFDELMQLINDCLNQISKASIEQKYEIIKEKLLSEQDPQIKQDLLKEYMALNQELKKN